METTLIQISPSTFFMIGLGVINLLVLGPVAWILKGALSDLRSLEKSHGQMQVSLPTEYVRQEAHNRAIDHIEVMLDKIYSELKGKVDK